MFVNFFIFSLLVLAVAADKCEVCEKVLNDIMAKVPEADKSKSDVIGRIAREHCAGTKNKDNKFCFYIGALPESATSIMNEIQKPLSWSMPADKVCDKLKTKDAQIYKPLDWKTIDLKKMRVKELKNILSEWGEVCKGCTEKTEFIKKIEELKPKYVKTEL